MRIRREEWARLDPGDVAWVTEWQLAAAFPWIPVGQESQVLPDPGAEDEFWPVRIRAGSGASRAYLPLRDLARVIAWCYHADAEDLVRPPATIRVSLAAIRRALRRALVPLDPLAHMGYRERQAPRG